MIIRIKKGIGEYERLVSYGAQNRSLVDKFCAFLLALSPILQHYRGLYENAGFTVLLFVFPILTLRFFSGRGRRKISMKNLSAVLPLLLFEIYTAVDHSVSVPRLLYIAFMMWIFICVSCGCINTVYFVKYASDIVSIAALLLIVQYISHYIFHHTLNLRPLRFLVSQGSIWVRHMGLSNAGKLYRPAAFFLEPSHLFLYSFPLLCILILSPHTTKWSRNKAILVTLAMLMSTSGFSIAVCIGFWALYLLLYKKGAADRHLNLRKVFSLRNIFVFSLLILLLALTYNFIPIFQRSVDRVFSDTEGTNAISGRIRLARNYIGTISGRAVLFGASNVTSNLDFNLAGFFATYIKWGIIGLALSYWFYSQGLFILKKKYFWMSVVIVVISFFTAHTHGTFYMLYYIIFLMNGYYEQQFGVSGESEREALRV